MEKQEKQPTRSAAAVLAVMFAFVSGAFGQLAPAGEAKPSAAAGTTAPSPTPAKLPEWDVVSVKLADPNHCTEGSGLQFTSDGVHIFCVPLQVVVQFAYGIMDPSRITGVPDWVKSGRAWNIDAKVAGGDAAAFGKLSRDDRNRMIEALLVERFHLEAHIEKREMPVYDLVVAKSGQKLKEASAEEAGKGFMGMHGPGKVEGIGVQLSFLPSLLNHEVGRPVLDKTGLTGKYDFTLEFVPASKAAADETGGPSIFTAVEEQLGLKLEPAKEPMDVLVIDSIEQPAAN